MKKGTQVSEKIPAANRQYKDTVFRMLFSEKENLLSLYNAVTGNAYQNADDLKIVTLENAIYMGMKNDLAFMLETNIYLYEHQSTLNPNIPLRDLIYIGIEYQQYVDDKSLYSSRLQKIPAPKFMVFYNGTDAVAVSYTHLDVYKRQGYLRAVYDADCGIYGCSGVHSAVSVEICGVDAGKSFSVKKENTSGNSMKEDRYSVRIKTG